MKEYFFIFSDRMYSLILCKVHALGVTLLLPINLKNTITMVSQRLAMRNIPLTLQRKKRLRHLNNYTQRTSYLIFYPLSFFLLVEQKIETWYLYFAKHLLLPWKTWQWHKTRTWILLFEVKLIKKRALSVPFP